MQALETPSMNPVLRARLQRRAEQDVSTKIMIDGDQMHVRRTQDCTPIAERAYAMHKEGMHGSKELKLAASIPMVIIEKYCNDHGISFHEVMSDPIHFKRMCNDPDNKMFRVWPGVI